MLLREQNGSGRRPFNGSLPWRRQRPKQSWTLRNMLHNVIYVSGLYVWSSKVKSRLTPPKAFEPENYTLPPNRDADPSPSRIPKIIHQSYKSLSSLPAEWSDTPSRWRELHPSYEYKFWSDDDNRALVQQHYPWFLDAYDNYPAPIQRADAARYLAVLHYGGIYADMDILPIRNVDPLLRQLDLDENAGREMLVAETYNLGLTNALFAAVPNSTLLHRFVRELPSHTKPLHGLEPLCPHLEVMLSTGPTSIWIYLNKYRAKIITLNPAGWGQCHQCRPKQCVTQEGSFFETRRGGSWHRWDTRIINFGLCHGHFCIWGGLCAVLWVFGKRSERRLPSSGGGRGRGGRLDPIPEAEEEDDGRGAREAVGKRRRWNVTGASLENVAFVLRMFASRHRFPIFCGVILLLVF